MKETFANTAVEKSSFSFSIKGVIFDMDGTLIASTEADYLAWKMLFKDHGKELTYKEYEPLLGIKSADLVEAKLKLHGEQMQQALQQKLKYFKEIMQTNGIDTIPYAEAFIKELKSYPVKIALATSSRRMKMEMVMEEVGFLHYFDAIVTGEEVTYGKPSPDIFLKAAARLHLSPDECIVIEDAVAGVAAAKNAQMKCIAITTTQTTDQLDKADMVVNSFKGLNFEQLNKRLYS